MSAVHSLHIIFFGDPGYCKQINKTKSLLAFELAFYWKKGNFEQYNSGVIWMIISSLTFKKSSLKLTMWIILSPILPFFYFCSYILPSAHVTTYIFRILKTMKRTLTLKFHVIRIFETS